MKILVILGCILGILLSISIVHADGLRLSRSKIQLLVGEKATIKSSNCECKFQREKWFAEGEK